MPLIKKTGQKVQENGRIFQNGEPRSHCAVPITEINEKKPNKNSKLEQVDDKQDKNFELT